MSRFIVLKIFIILFIILIWLLAAGLFAFSLWFILDYFHQKILDSNNELQSGLKEFLNIVYIFLTGEGLIIVFSIVGIVGALKPSRLILIIFLISLIIAFLLQLAAPIYGYIYREEIKSTIADGNFMREKIFTDYGDSSTITLSIDIMQSELKCCGGRTYNEYQTSEWAKPIGNEDPRQGMVPASCCSGYLKNIDTSLLCPINTELPSGGSVIGLELNSNLHQKGCGDALVDFVSKNILIIAGIGISILGLEIVTMLLVIVLIFKLRTAPALLQSDDVVYEMARTQEKSPYPTRGGGSYVNFYK